MYQNINLLNCEILKNQTFSDHDPIILTCGLCLEPEGKTTFRNTAFLKNPSTVENYVETLRVEISECSGKLLSATTCSEAFNVFNETFLKVTDRFAPICNFPPKNLLPKWLNKSLLKIRSKRNQAHRKWKKDCHNQAKLQEFKKWRLTFEKEYKKSKKQYYQNKSQACQTDSRRTYKLLNDINGKSKTFNDPPLLNTCRQNYKLPSIKNNADVFNKFFANVGEGLSNHLTAAHDVDIPNCVHSMFFFPTTKREVESVYRSLQNKSSSGDDLVCNSIVKASMPATLNVITNLINRSFNEGLFRDSLKTAKIVPLFKDGSKLEENNYHPISLLIIWSKIFEKVVFNRVYGYFEKLGILSKYQFGFRDKHSTIDALVELTEKIRHSGKENAINSFFLDLKKAFDTINHNLLLKKLERYGIRGKCLMWFESYLTNRRQRVFLNNVSSDWEISNCGVPHGSILGPLLFLIYINNLPQNCNLNVLLFADDTNITSIGNSRAEISLELAKINN